MRYHRKKFTLGAKVFLVLIVIGIIEAAAAFAWAVWL